MTARLVYGENYTHLPMKHRIETQGLNTLVLDPIDDAVIESSKCVKTLMAVQHKEAPRGLLHEKDSGHWEPK